MNLMALPVVTMVELKAQGFIGPSEVAGNWGLHSVGDAHNWVLETLGLGFWL